MSRVRLASVSEARGDADTAAHLCAQCIEIARDFDDGTLLNTTRVVLARIARARGDLRDADALTDQALRAPEMRQRDLLIITTNERGFTLALRGRRDEAEALFREVLRMSRTASDVRFVATALEGVAGCLADTDAARAGVVAGGR